MIRSFICGLFFLLAAPLLFADGARAFIDANRSFKSGDFEGAAAAYEKILAEDGPRAAVFYNLGNCYQNLKRYGPAILAYERARLLTPRDPDLLNNLSLARKAAAAFEENGTDPRLEAVLDYLSRNEWSWLVVVCAMHLGCLSVAWGVLRPANRTFRQAAMGSVVVSGVLIASGALALYLRRDEGSRGIVLKDKAAVHLSPFENAESLGTPGPGKVVHIRGKSGDFRYVEVPGTGLKGWLSTSEVAAIAPENPDH